MAKAKFTEGQSILYSGSITQGDCIMDVTGMLVTIFRVHDGPDYTEPLYSIEWGKSSKATVREGKLTPIGDLAQIKEKT